MQQQERLLIRTDDPQFSRDGPYGAVLNTDKVALELYMKERSQSLLVNQVVQDVATLKNDINWIKEALGKLITNG